MRYVLRICVLTFLNFGAKFMPTKAQEPKGRKSNEVIKSTNLSNQQNHQRKVKQ